MSETYFESCSGEGDEETGASHHFKEALEIASSPILHMYRFRHEIFCLEVSALAGCSCVWVHASVFCLEVGSLKGCLKAGSY